MTAACPCSVLPEASGEGGATLHPHASHDQMFSGASRHGFWVESARLDESADFAANARVRAGLGGRRCR